MSKAGNAALQTTVLRRSLRGTFGLDRFRPGQAEVIDSVLAGHDTLAVMPTGAGKSLCYRLLRRGDARAVVRRVRQLP